MSHCESEVLALRALGEPAGRAEDDLHLRSCAACREELSGLARAVAAGRGARADEGLEAPPARVWSAISAELGLAAAPARAAAGPTRQVDPVVRPLRRRIAPLLLAAAAAVGAVAGIGGTLLLVQRATAPDAVAEVLARAALDPLPTWDVTGSAELMTRDGERTLRVELPAAAAENGYREVWLLDAAAARLVPLGVLDGDTGDFTLPAGLDVAQYPVVDISLEPFDGDPNHSGDSIVRGTLGV